MSDLVARLRGWRDNWDCDTIPMAKEAADRIEKLERERDELRALLKEARTEMEWWTPDEAQPMTLSEEDHLNRWFALRDRIDALLTAR